ncbi:mucin-5AC-like [Scylla paramamosain]|uniref:mucin-5AC-like n=1 Tax=Scylla paramamosain TaxID=85552 RepID=UPI003082FB3C
MADETAPSTTAPSTTQSTTAPSTTPSTTASSTTPSTTAPSTEAPSTTAPSTSPSTTAPSTSPSTTAPSTSPSTTAPSTTAPSATAPSTTAPSTTAPSSTDPSTTVSSTTTPSTTAPSATAPSTTAPSTSPSTTAPSTTAPSTTAPSTTAPSTTAPSVTPSSTPLATATAGLSEEASSNTKEEDKTKRETDKREPKNEETQRLQRSEKTVDGAKRRGYPKKKPHGAGVKREATPSVSVTDKLSLEATFQFHVKNFSKVNMPLWSAPCWLHGMPWMIRAGPITVPFNENEKKEKKFLSVGLRCEGVWGAAFWACYGIADFSLLPVNRKQAPHVVGIECLFQKNVRLGIVNQFMLWENVLNPHHGYIEDDAVTFKVRLRTAPPYVINWSSDRLVRAPTQTLAVPPPHVTSGRKDEDCNSDVNENDSDDDSDDKDYNDEDSDDEDMNKYEGLYAQKNLHMYI